LTLTFRGRVVGPTFHFDHFDVDLGVVPYGFETVKRLRFSNTSKIAMSYKLRLSEEDVAPNEYLITPSSGQLGPMESVDVDLTFRPRHVKKYDAHLMVDVRDVGDNLLCLPFFAQSYVPKVRLDWIVFIYHADYG
jgi:hydrocephalus-inducing protein